MDESERPQQGGFIGWWKRVNAKPPNWDTPGERWARILGAIALGLILFWAKSRH